jgi:hypothetical protein
MTYNINHLYPDVNVIDMTTDIYIADDEDKYNNNLKKLDELTLDINNFVIIFNINPLILSRFYALRMAKLSIPTRGYENVTDDDELIVFRNAKALVCPKETENDEKLMKLLKTLFREQVFNDCMICFCEFEAREKRVYCVNCNNQICQNCISKYLPTNAGWCPCCRQHLLFEDLKQPDETDYKFNSFLRKCLRRLIKNNPYVQRVAGEHVLECFNRAKELQQRPLYRNVNFFDDSETDSETDSDDG